MEEQEKELGNAYKELEELIRHLKPAENCNEAPKKELADELAEIKKRCRELELELEEAKVAAKEKEREMREKQEAADKEKEELIFSMKQAHKDETEKLKKESADALADIEQRCIKRENAITLGLKIIQEEAKLAAKAVEAVDQNILVRVLYILEQVSIFTHIRDRKNLLN